MRVPRVERRSMEVLGIGVDMVDVERIERALARHERFASRLFTDRERERCLDCARPGRRFAACFAAKEAASKAMGTGIKGFTWKELELLADAEGRPVLLLSGRALEVARSRGIREILVSVTHTRDTALAFAQALGEERK